MKNSLIKRVPLNIKVIALLGLIGILFIKTSTAASPPYGVSFQVFYDQLLPYGDWIQDPVHGYVWVPYAEPNFQPYATNGYWVMSTYGNTWVSNYDWGWAPFHYGRWYFDDYLGWAWVPGYEWGPAWVNWRTGGGFYGWAPLGPGINIHLSINIPSHHWVFVPRRRLISRHVYNYYIPRNNVYRIYNQTTIINNTYVYNNRTYVSGPERREIERVTRRSVPVYRVDNSQKPGRAAVRRNALQIYRPEIQQVANNNSRSQPRPSRVVTANEHRVNVANRTTGRNNGKSLNARTIPANSRGTVNRTERSGTNDPSVSRRAVVSPQYDSRTNTNRSRIQSPTQKNQTASPSRRQSNVTRQRTEQPGVRVSPGRNVKSSSTPQRSTVQTRSTSPRQVRTGSPTNRRENTVQPSRSRTQVRTQPAQRSRNTPAQVSSRSSRERSSGHVTRSSSQRSPRRNN